MAKLRIHKWGRTFMEYSRFDGNTQQGIPLCEASSNTNELWVTKTNKEVTCKHCLKIMEKKT